MDRERERERERSEIREWNCIGAKNKRHTTHPPTSIKYITTNKNKGHIILLLQTRARAIPIKQSLSLKIILIVVAAVLFEP